MFICSLCEKREMKEEKGITLVALVVTIIIMLILAGVALSMAIGENGLFTMSKKAADTYKESQTNEEQEMKSAEKELKKLTQGLTVTATVNGEEVELTKENVKDYLGSVVGNFKNTVGTTESVEIAGDTETTSYNVSTTYRLYYVDFDNKYGDGAGTIYLKADCPSYSGNSYALKLDTTGADEKGTDGTTKVKIKQLNPSLYMDKDKNKLTAPSKDNNNMQAVTWLLNTEKWAHLKNTVKEEVQGEINYIVGAPSLEMMMDSYNTHYNLTGDAPEPGAVESTGDTRKKLFYKYEGTSSTNTTGYKVGPGSSEDYSTLTANYTVKSDPDIDTMYYPGSGNYYWLASPSAYGSSNV